MPIFIPPERARRIAALTIDIERAQNAIATLTAEVARIDARLQHLTRDRQRGVIRDALSILRRAGAPMAIRALTVALMAERGLDTTDGALVRLHTERLRTGLLRQRESGIVRQEGGLGRSAAMWSIAR